MGSAESLDDLRVPPGNRLEALKGDRAAPIHPGEVLMEDFIEGFGIRAEDLAGEQIAAIAPLQTA